MMRIFTDLSWSPTMEGSEKGENISSIGDIRENRWVSGKISGFFRFIEVGSHSLDLTTNVKCQMPIEIMNHAIT